MVLSELISSGVVLLGSDLRLLWANRTFSALIASAATASPADPRGWLNAVDSEDHAALRDVASQVGPGVVREVTVRFVAGEVSRWVRLVLTGDVSPGGGELIGVAHDVIERRAQADGLPFDGLHDPVTGLMNRHRVREVIEELLSSRRRSDREIAVLAVHLTGLEAILQRHGAAGVEHVLVEASRRLRHVARTEDVVARWEDDAFLVVARFVGTLDDAWAAARRHHTELSRPYHLGGSPELVPVRIGLGMPHEGSIASADQL